jgi:hypothetical protein
MTAEAITLVCTSAPDRTVLRAKDLKLIDGGEI